ncbi:MAG: histone family protein DNA-binding protein, partial [Frankiales bacterium]|nr:histone family protein DNA-binding protein [Frankiales bacterium]
MNRAELIEAVTERIGDKRTAGAAVEAVLDVITRAVAAGEKVSLTGFGIFEKVERAARTARNPSTGESIDVAETAVPKFRAGSAFKEVVADPRKLPAAAYEGATAGVGATVKAGAAALAVGAAAVGAASSLGRGKQPPANASTRPSGPAAQRQTAPVKGGL